VSANRTDGEAIAASLSEAAARSSAAASSPSPARSRRPRSSPVGSPRPRIERRTPDPNAVEVGGFDPVYPKATHLDAEQTKEELINILFEGAPSPRLQAAICDALAEVPGVEVVGATDSLGRQGDAIKFAAEEGVRREYLFDPETSNLLADRGVIVDPAASRSYKALPAGTTIGERDFISSGVVGSTGETPAGPEARG
jgi:hypothetical protein